jgi:hypothetical protein
MMRMPRRTDHDLAQLANFGMDAEWCVVCHDLILFKV